MVKSFRGKDVNMMALFHKNEKKIALGNSHMNARGDIIGKGGIIMKSREEQIKEYQESLKQQEGYVSMKNAEELTDLEKKLRTVSKPEKIVPKKKKVEQKVEETKVEPEKTPEVIFDEE